MEPSDEGRRNRIRRIWRELTFRSARRRLSAETAAEAERWRTGKTLFVGPPVDPEFNFRGSFAGHR